jgi:hypothetical protein
MSGCPCPTCVGAAGVGHLGGGLTGGCTGFCSKNGLGYRRHLEVSRAEEGRQQGRQGVLCCQRGCVRGLLKSHVRGGGGTDGTTSRRAGKTSTRSPSNISIYMQGGHVGRRARGGQQARHGASHRSSRASQPTTWTGQISTMTACHHIAVWPCTEQQSMHALRLG